MKIMLLLAHHKINTHGEDYIMPLGLIVKGPTEFICIDGILMGETFPNYYLDDHWDTMHVAVNTTIKERNELRNL